MKNKILTSLLLTLFSAVLTAQTSSNVKYFKDENLKKEVSIDNAKYSETNSTKADTIIREVKKLTSGEIISRQCYKETEPIGKWKCQTGSGVEELDYNFSLNYSDSICLDSIKNTKISNYFENDETIGYIAPKISTGEENIFMFLMMRVRYPERALENNITGTVYLTFRISNKGQIENIAIKKGVNIVLDKEAVRVIRLLKFSSPPYLKDKPVSICVTFPFKFNLQ